MTATPTATRIESVDFVRGVALFGILLMNITSMGLASGAYDNPTVDGGATGANLWTWIVTNVGFEGTQRALFSMLFGAGVILFTSRLEASGRSDAADLYLRRTMLLILFGMANAYLLLWNGDVLYMYGAVGLFLFVFRKLPGRTLLVIGAAGLLAGAALNAVDASRTNAIHAEAQAAERVPAAQRSEAQRSAIESWTEKRGQWAPDAAAVEEERQKIVGGYFSAWQERASDIAWWQSWGLYRYFFDAFGMMMIGMGLFSLGVLTGQVPVRTYAIMVAAGYGIGITLNLYELRLVMDSGFQPHGYAQAGITYDASRLATTCGHLGLIMLFVRSDALPRFRRAMAAVGRMALTNYLSHSAIALVVFVFLGWFGALERHQLYFVVFAIWAAQLALSPWWLRRFHFGPVEWLWRALTYGTQPPLRKVAALPASAVPAE